MNANLNIKALQIPIFWEDDVKNRAYIDKHLNLIDKETDIILLPEMFTSGFTMNTKKVVQSMRGSSILWMHAWAENLNVLLGGSLVIQENENIYKNVRIEKR